MPKDPRGEKRPADAIGLAVMIGKIGTGEIEDTSDDLKSAAARLGSKGGGHGAMTLVTGSFAVGAGNCGHARSIWHPASPAPTR